MWAWCRRQSPSVSEPRRLPRRLAPDNGEPWVLSTTGESRQTGRTLRIAGVTIRANPADSRARRCARNGASDNGIPSIRRGRGGIDEVNWRTSGRSHNGHDDARTGTDNSLRYEHFVIRAPGTVSNGPFTPFRRGLLSLSLSLPRGYSLAVKIYRYPGERPTDCPLSPIVSRTVTRESSVL